MRIPNKVIRSRDVRALSDSDSDSEGEEIDVPQDPGTLCQRAASNDIGDGDSMTSRWGGVAREMTDVSVGGASEDEMTRKRQEDVASGMIDVSVDGDLIPDECLNQFTYQHTDFRRRYDEILNDVVTRLPRMDGLNFDDNDDDDAVLPDNIRNSSSDQNKEILNGTCDKNCICGQNLAAKQKCVNQNIPRAADNDSMLDGNRITEKMESNGACSAHTDSQDVDHSYDKLFKNRWNRALTCGKRTTPMTEAARRHVTEYMSDCPVTLSFHSLGQGLDNYLTNHRPDNFSLYSQGDVGLQPSSFVPGEDSTLIQRLARFAEQRSAVTGMNRIDPVTGALRPETPPITSSSDNHRPGSSSIASSPANHSTETSTTTSSSANHSTGSSSITSLPANQNTGSSHMTSKAVSAITNESSDRGVACGTQSVSMVTDEAEEKEKNGGGRKIEACLKASVGVNSMENCGVVRNRVKYCNAGTSTD